MHSAQMSVTLSRCHAVTLSLCHGHGLPRCYLHAVLAALLRHKQSGRNKHLLSFPLATSPCPPPPTSPFIPSSQNQSGSCCLKGPKHEYGRSLPSFLPTRRQWLRNGLPKHIGILCWTNVLQGHGVRPRPRHCFERDEAGLHAQRFGACKYQFCILNIFPASRYGSILNSVASHPARKWRMRLVFLHPK